MPKWEYLTVKLGYFGFNDDIAAAQYVNEKEIKDWKKPPMSTFLNQLGADNWEMSGNLTVGGASNYLFFKRPKP